MHIYIHIYLYIFIYCRRAIGQRPQAQTKWSDLSSGICIRMSGEVERLVRYFSMRDPQRSLTIFFAAHPGGAEGRRPRFEPLRRTHRMRSPLRPDSEGGSAHAEPSAHTSGWHSCRNGNKAPGRRRSSGESLFLHVSSNNNKRDTLSQYQD